ncbi:MAG: PPC domain-containing protein [Planctomycetaceae bacterium]
MLRLPALLSCFPLAGLCGGLLSSVLAVNCFAQAPTIARTTPQAVAPGQTADIVVSGGNLAGATSLWTSFGAPAALTPDKAGNGTDAASATFRVTAPAENSLGIHGIRVVTPGGVSSLKLFVVDDLPSVAEAAGNNAPETAQAVAVPCAIDGQVDNLSRDYFKFDVASGQKISFEILARRLGSPLDPSLYLYRADGREVHFVDDTAGLSSDCQFAYTFADAGSYIIEVRDIQFAGGGNHLYRLRIGDFPCVNTPVPMAVQRGSTTAISFAGSSVEDAAPATLAVPADGKASWMNVATKRAGGVSSAFAAVKVSDAPEFLEQEPNDSPEQANGIAIGTSVNGRLDKTGDIDRFAFDAKAGQRFDFAGISRQSGAPSDLMLRIYDPAGKQVAAVDDVGANEGSVNYAFPADGRYTLAVHDLNRRGGPSYAYRVAVTPFQAGFSLQSTTDAVNVAAGGITAVLVNATRQEYDGPIELSLAGLPPGLTSLPTRIGPGTALAVLTVQSAADAAPATLSNVQVVGKATVNGAEVQRVAAVETALRGVWSNALQIPGELTESVALSVGPAAKLKLRTEPAEIVFGKGLAAKVKVIAERGEGLDAAIALAVNPEKGGLPANVTADVKPIAAGTNEIEITFTGAENAPLGPFTVVLTGSHAKDNVTTTASAPGIGLRLEAPFVLQPTVANAKLTRGGATIVKVAVQRNPAFAGEIKLTFDKLPTGVTAPETVLPADKSEVEIALMAAADAAVGAANTIVVNGAAVANAKQTGTAGVPAITVE